MARSKYIYLIKHGDEVDSVFTVKYEMEKYLDENLHLHNVYEVTTIFRFRDGGDAEPVEITEEYFN